MSPTRSWRHQEDSGKKLSIYPSFQGLYFLACHDVPSTWYFISSSAVFLTGENALVFSRWLSNAEKKMNMQAFPPLPKMTVNIKIKPLLPLWISSQERKKEVSKYISHLNRNSVHFSRSDIKATSFTEATRNFPRNRLLEIPRSTGRNGNFSVL